VCCLSIFTHSAERTLVLVFGLVIISNKMYIMTCEIIFPIIVKYQNAFKRQPNS